MVIAESQRERWSLTATTIICESMSEPEACRFPDDHSIAELRAIATKALGEGDAYGRALVREEGEAGESAG